MGSSKKHKDREHKRKRRHKSRSRSKSRERSDNKHRREHADEPRQKRSRRDRAAAAGSPTRGIEASREPYYDHRIDFIDREDGEIEESVNVKPEAYHDSSKPRGDGTSLSIEETNRLRAKLGLKPLEVKGSKSGSSSKQDDVHAPPVNLAAIKHSAELREKMLQLREKRRINKLLGKVKTLGSESDDDSALAWVQKNRKLQQQKEKAAKTAKQLQDMDDEFGVGDLVEEAFGEPKEKKSEYVSHNLSGLRVEHAQEAFKEGKTIILTLKDRGVLDDDGDGDPETLVNVNMVDEEKAAKNIENKKKKPDYKPYDEPQYDEYGMVKATDVLDKYDEEIHGQQKESFQLGSGGKYNTVQERNLQRMKDEVRQRGETLQLAPPTIASEFFTTGEMEGFNKVQKKKRKIRKKPKVTADSLLSLGGATGMDHGSRNEAARLTGEAPDMSLVKAEAAIPGLDLVDMDVDDVDPFDDAEILGPEDDLTGVPVEEDSAANELELALNKARKLKHRRDTPATDRRLADQLILKREQEMEEDEEEEAEEQQRDRAAPMGRDWGNIMLNSTSEFCRSLGEIPTYGMAGNRPEEEEEELAEFEEGTSEERKKQLEGEGDPLQGWQSVEIDTRPVEIKDESTAVLEEEPVLSGGIAGALELAGKKGYLEKEVTKVVSAPRHVELQAKNYSIEDKRYDDLDEKFRKRDRYQGGGMVMDFKDKDSYQPDVKLEYVDEAGRTMNPKEAFRYLSHRFHGKGSGKKKTEKRMKKLEEEQLMKSMSSTDTPLGTVQLLQEKQEREKTPYIVLSGGRTSTTTIAK